MVIKDSLYNGVEIAWNENDGVIPEVACECYGNSDLYYSKENPQIGIDVLKRGILIGTNKNFIADDLGYILRDEGRIEEAIEAFHISLEYDPTSAYVYLELSNLFERIGQVEKQKEYLEKFKESGGIIF